MDKLDFFSATEILQRIDTGELTSRAVTQHFIDRIEQVNPALNAVVIKLFDNALQQADYADQLFRQGKRTGKLHGLPFTIKECLDLKGTPSTIGLMRRKADTRQNTDPYVAALQIVRRIRLITYKIKLIMICIKKNQK